MERTINVEVSLNGLEVQEKPIFCQGDKNTHFLSVSFMEDMNLSGYTLQVYYLPPYPCVTPYVDLYSEVTTNPFKVPIPNKILERNGQVKVEFSLSKESELITVNKTFNFEVIRTMNGTGVTAYPEGTLKETIAQQIEKIKILLAQTDEKINEYNNNATFKTEQYNNNSTEKFNSFNQNYDKKLESFNSNDAEKISTFNDNAAKKLKEYNDNDALKTQNYNNNAEEKKNEFNNNATQVANKFTDYISDTLNKATTEMDRRATVSANAAGERANQEVKKQEGLSVQTVTNEGTKQVGLVGTKGTEEVEKVQAAGAQAISDINANKNAHIKAVTDEGNKQVLAVGNKGIEEVSKVESAGAKAVEDVNANKTANIQAVTEEGTKQTGLVADKGAEQTKLVTDEGTKQTTAVGNKGTEETSKVTDEGSKQIKAVQNQGTVSLETIINIQKQIEQLLKNQEAIGNALSLNGKTGVQYDKEIQSVAGMNFDPDLQFLNDTGTKKVGFCYLDRLTDGIFECIKQTTAVVNDSSCFKNFSNKENSDKLGNLSKELPDRINEYNSNAIQKTSEFDTYVNDKLATCSTNLENKTSVEVDKAIEQVKKLVGVNPAGGDAVSVGGLTRPEIEKEINKNSIRIISTSNNLLFDKSKVFINKVNAYTTSTFSGFKSKVTIDKNRKAMGVTVTLKARETAITKIKFTVSLNNLLINEYIEDITIMPKTEKDVNVHFLKELDLKNGDILEIGYQCNQLCDGIFYRNKEENSDFTENYYTTNGIINDNWQLIGSDNKCIYYCFLEKYPIKKIKEIENIFNTSSKIKLAPNDINNFPLCNNDIPEKIADKKTATIGYGFYINKTDLFNNGDLTGIKLNGFDIVKTDELEKELLIEFIDQNNFKVLKSYKTKIKPNDIDNYFINCFIKKEELIELPEEMTLGIRTSVRITPSYDSTFKYKEKNQLHNTKPDFENYYEYPFYYDGELKRWWPFEHLTNENYTCPNVEFLYSYGVVTDKKLSKRNMPADSFIVGENIKRIDFDIKRIENNMSIKPKLLLKLPEKFDLVVGDTFELFYKGIINASNTDYYDISIDSSKNIGQAYKRKYVYTPKSSEIGERAVTFNLLDNLGNKLESQQVIFNIVDVPKNPTEIKNILCVGDSLSAYGVWINEFRKRLIGTSSHIPFNITNVNFIGTKEKEGTMFEGYGGWTYNSYLTANVSSDFMYIYGTFDKTEVDQHSVYKDSDGNQWKLETITPNKIKIIQISWISTLPSSGTLTWVSGGQNHSNIVYTSSEQAEGNPFWNVNTKAVDFSWYAQKHKVSKIDYIYILLGWNETHKTTEQLTNDCKQLLNYILKDFPDCKIGLIGLQVPSQNGFGENYGTDWKYYDKLQHIWRLQEIYQTISKEPQYTGKVDYINISAQFDSEYNMPHEERNANIRTTQKEYVQTNGVHPATDGYLQIADAVLRNFITKLI